MKFGLEENIIEKITQTLEMQPKVDKAYIFGSRAKGNYRPDSDIDIAVKGYDLTVEDILKLSAAIDKSSIGYEVDLIDYGSFKEEALRDHVDRVGIEFYSSWKKHKIGEIVTLEYGKSLQNYQHDEGPYEVFGTNGKIGTSEIYLYDKPSVIIGRKGAYREVFLAEKPFYVIDTAFYTKNKIGTLDTYFLYYWFKNIDINEMDSGSAIPSTSRDEVYDLDIFLPPLSEQRYVATALRSLDNKIDLLNRQNKTLESMAEALFKKRFIEEVKDDWKEQSLLEVIELIGGGTPKTDNPDYWDGNIKWLSGGDIATNHKRFVTTTEKSISEKGLQNSSAKLLPKFSTIITARGTVGKYCLLLKPMAFSQSNYGILPKHGDYFFFTNLLIGHAVEELQAAAYGSVFDTITTSTFKGYQIPLPEIAYIQQFEDTVSIFFEKILSNTLQISSLVDLRDTLLPKLLSGEARIKMP